MEVYMLDKAIENEKLDLEIAIGQINKLKEKLSQSLKRRKNIATQMDDNIYIEEKIKDISQDKCSKKVDAVTRELIEKNHILQDEVTKLRREQEIQLVRMCEIMEQKDKANEEKRLLPKKIEEKNNEIYGLSIQQVDLIDQLNDENQELINLRT